MSGRGGGGEQDERWHASPDDSTLFDAEAPRAVSTPEAASDSLLPSARTVGRFRILRKVGQGGLGTVYSAYDEVLERRVAIKLIRGDRRADVTPARMLREAQALAQVNHPNVVQIYDAGEHEGHLYIAMEFVLGPTLREWVKTQAPSSVHAILDMYIQAGRGLEAAHAAGLIHRDFKPTNVLVGDDHRARVADFGLVTMGGEMSATRLSPGASPRALGVDLTVEGSVVGTPRYMSPEQFRGEPADARSDQFSFCVSLSEALFGVHPFEDGEESATRDTRGDKHGGRRIPANVRDAIQRGLEARPDARWPTMGALLRELERSPATRWRQWAAAGVAIAVTAGVGVAYSVHQRREQARCERAGDAVFATWDEPARARLDASLAALEMSHGASTRARVAAGLDRWAETWSDRRVEACAADDTDDASTRGRCLDGQLLRFQGLVTVLEQPDDATGHGAIEAVASLPRPALCEQALWLASETSVQRPSGRVRMALRMQSLARAAHLAGRFDRAMAYANQALTIADALEEDELRADAKLTIGELHTELGDFAKAEQALREAFSLSGVRGDDRVAAQAALALCQTVGDRQARPAEARVWAQQAEVVVRRLGQEEQRMGSLYLSCLAAIERREGDNGAAIEHLERSIEIRARVLDPQHPEVALAKGDLAVVLEGEAAIASAREALALAEHAFGSRHPNTVVVMGNLAAALERHATETGGSYDEALTYLRRTVTSSEAVFGADHLNTGGAHNNLASALRDLGRTEEALEHYRRTLAIVEGALGSSHPVVSTTCANLARALRDDGRFSEALEYTRRAMEAVKELAPAHPDRLHVVNLLGDVLREAGQLEEAERVLVAALGDAGSSEVLRTRVVLLTVALTEVYRAQARYSDAEDQLAPLLDADWLGPLERADVEFGLAQILRATSREPERARALAERAKEAYAAGGPSAKRYHAKVERWLSSPSPSPRGSPSAP